MLPITRYLARHASVLALVCTILPGATSATGTVSTASPAERLHAAATVGDITAIKQALASGVAINARNAAGATPLLLATESNQVEAARVLIEAGADVNARNAIRNSPYLYAGARGLNEILQGP